MNNINPGEIESNIKIYDSDQNINDKGKSKLIDTKQIADNTNKSRKRNYITEEHTIFKKLYR